MKKLIKKIGQNKFQFIFFASLVFLVVLAIVIASVDTKAPVTTNPDDDPTDIKKPDEPKPSVDDEEVNLTADELVSLPFDSTLDYHVVRKFYEKDASKEDQAKSLIKYDNTFRTSLGTSYALKNGGNFDVVTSITGTVTEISSSPLFGTYVVLSSDENVKTYYYGLSEVSINKGAMVKQGEKIGSAGTTAVDQETGVHVYFQITKDGKYINPEKAIGCKVKDLAK